MLFGRQRSTLRWALVGLLVAVLAALPVLIGRIPADDDGGQDAASVRAAVLASADVPFSGYAESAGGLTLPLTDVLTSVADLFSDRTTMRTWYRGADDWRVDVVSATGETGLHRDATGTWTWQYEDARASRAADQPLALPSAPDLLPSDLGRRLVSEAGEDQLTRIGARRVAGRDALGLRLVPAEPGAAVSRVELWVDAATGLTLQVQAFGPGSSTPAIDARFLDVSFVRPPASTTAFTPPPGADIETDRGLPVRGDGRSDESGLPAELAGLPRRQLDGVQPTVGVFGRGVTLLTAVPVSGRFAAQVRRQLEVAPGAVLDDAGVRLAAGPLGVMVVDGGRGPDYLLAGTVTLDALATAAADLPAAGSRG